jgi:hypothetical protein
MPFGEFGEDSPPQPVSNVAKVAPDATWQAPAQNRRRETSVCLSDIAIVEREWA